MIWTYLQQFSGQLISFGVSLILARFILPEEFGLIGMITIFVGIGTVLTNGGLTSSLIRTQDLNDDDFSTVFIFNLVTSLVIYIILFLCAPLIADFYKQPRLSAITQVYGLTFIIGAFGAVQQTILTKNLEFKKLLIVNLPALIISSIVGVVLALNHFGVWALVWSYITSNVATSVFLWLQSDWRPNWGFSKNKFKQHFSYGSKLTISGVLDIVFVNLYQIVIGRYYSAALVGYYSRANTTMMLPVSTISTALNSVMFPLFSKVQDDLERLRDAYKKVMLMVLFIVSPIITLMGILAKPMIVFLFTEAWLPVVPIFQILCFTAILYPIHSYNLIILQVKGRSDLFLKLEVVKKILTSIILIISFYFGFWGLLWGQLIFSVLTLFINTYFAGKMLNYSMLQQLKDISPIFIMSILAGIGVYVLNRSIDHYISLWQLLICGTSGILIYFSIAWLTNFQIIKDIREIIIKR